MYSMARSFLILRIMFDLKCDSIRKTDKGTGLEYAFSVINCQSKKLSPILYAQYEGKQTHRVSERRTCFVSAVYKVN
jgi:hypothetical protein